MKYVVFTENSDHYFDSMLFCTDNIDEAELFCDYFWDIVDRYSKIISKKYKWIHSRYHINNFDNSSYVEVEQMWWLEVIGSTKDSWFLVNCHKDFVAMCRRIDVDILKMVEDQFYVRFEKCINI